MNFLQRWTLKRLRRNVQNQHSLRERGGSAKLEIQAHYRLAAFYEKHLFDKDLPQADIYVLECYRAAATLGDPKAYYETGKRLLEKGKFWSAWSKNPIYGTPVHVKYAQALYDEALTYLREAEAQDHPLAKRLLGLAYVHGWGVPANLDEGYKKILDSIDLEQAWGRATRIFEELKLSSPEFFAALRERKK